MHGYIGSRVLVLLLDRLFAIQSAMYAEVLDPGHGGLPCLDQRIVRLPPQALRDNSVTPHGDLRHVLVADGVLLELCDNSVVLEAELARSIDSFF